MKFYLFSLITLSVLGLASTTLINLQRKDIIRLTRELDYYHTTYITREGGNAKYPTYSLLKVDGIWYARTSHGLKPAEEVYPGLVADIMGWEKLCEYVTKHGPIDLSKPEQAALLEGAGFTVQPPKSQP